MKIYGSKRLIKLLLSILLILREYILDNALINTTIKFW